MAAWYRVYRDHASPGLKHYLRDEATSRPMLFPSQEAAQSQAKVLNLGYPCMDWRIEPANRVYRLHVLEVGTKAYYAIPTHCLSATDALGALAQTIGSPDAIWNGGLVAPMTHEGRVWKGGSPITDQILVKLTLGNIL